MSPRRGALRAELPAGVAPLFGAAARRRRALENPLLALLEARGWDEVVLPVLDFVAPYELAPGAVAATAVASSQVLLARGDELYRFSDRDGEPLALRADFTPMLARLLAPRLLALELPLRCFYRGDVLRRRDAALGGEREHYELGAELIGVAGVEGDAEALRLLVELLRVATGATLRIVLGHAGALDELLLRAEDPAALQRAVVRRERGAARAGGAALLEVIEDGAPRDAAALGSAGAAALARLAELRRRLADLQGVEVAIDLAELAPGRRPELLATGAERPYYDGVVFRVWIGDEASPIGGGGRYDALFAALGAPVAAVGFALAVDRLAAIAERAEIAQGERGAEGVDEAVVGRAALRAGASPAPTSGIAWSTAAAGRDVSERRGGACPCPGTPAAPPSSAPARSAARALRLALPKGRNLAAALAALRVAGLDLSGLDPQGRRLWQRFPAQELEVLLLKDWDLPLYVEQGVADLGVVGSDVLDELGSELATPLRLRDGRCRLSLIGFPGALPPAGSAVRVASKYPLTARRALQSFPWAVEVFRLQGSVELAPLLQLGDLAFDVVQTGETLRAHGLAELEVVAEVAPCLVASAAACQRFRARIGEWVTRLEMAEVAT